MSAVFDDMLRLQQRGYVPYRGRVEDQVYVRLHCGRARRARWMHQGTKFVCLGCGRRCSLIDPPGFELLLPVPSKAKKLAFAVLPAVSARDLLDKKLFLTMPEVEFVLCISRSHIYELLDEGRLERHPDAPLRITADSVRKEATRCKEG